MRLFVAVNFDDSVLDAVERAIDAFPLDRPPWRWASRPTWHVTLKFLGETEPSRVDDVARALDTVAAEHAPFDLRLGPLDGFPNLRRPRVLFYDVVEGRDRLAALAADVDDALANAAGFPREKRPFHPHATVARIRNPLEPEVAARLGAAPPVEHPSMCVSCVDLMESRLGRGGAKYARIKQFALTRTP